MVCKISGCVKQDHFGPLRPPRYFQPILSRQSLYGIAADERAVISTIERTWSKGGNQEGVFNRAWDYFGESSWVEPLSCFH